MQIEFDVKMTTNKMYDYMLYHMFTSFQGILGEAIGVMLIAAFVASNKWVYLVAGLIVMLYLPIALYMNAKKQVLMNPAFKDVLHYTLTDEGVTIKVGQEEESQAWKDMRKAVSTGKSIFIYTSKRGASIFPKSDLGEQRMAVIEMISTHMDPKKVNIRG